MPEFPSDEEATIKSDKTMTMGLVLAAIVVGLILVGSLSKITSQEHPVNQPSTQSMADDSSKAPKVQE